MFTWVGAELMKGSIFLFDFQNRRIKKCLSPKFENHPRCSSFYITLGSIINQYCIIIIIIQNYYFCYYYYYYYDDNKLKIQELLIKQPMAIQYLVHS